MFEKCKKRTQVLSIRVESNNEKNIKVNARKESVTFTNCKCKKLQINLVKLKDFNRKSAVYQKKKISYYHIFAIGNDKSNNTTLSKRQAEGNKKQANGTRMERKITNIKKKVTSNK